MQIVHIGKTFDDRMSQDVWLKAMATTGCNLLNFWVKLMSISPGIGNLSLFGLFCLSSFVYLLPKTFNLFDIPILGRYLRFFFAIAKQVMKHYIFSGVRVTRSLVLYVCFVESLFVLLSFFF